MRKKVLIVSATYYVDFSKQLEMWAIKHLDNERIKIKLFRFQESLKYQLLYLKI